MKELNEYCTIRVYRILLLISTNCVHFISIFINFHYTLTSFDVFSFLFLVISVLFIRC